MMTSSNGNIFRVSGSLWKEIHRLPVDSPHKGQWRGALMFSLICAWTNSWANNRDTVVLRRHRARYNVIVAYSFLHLVSWFPRNKCCGHIFQNKLHSKQLNYISVKSALFPPGNQRTIPQYTPPHLWWHWDTGVQICIRVALNER